MIIINNKKGAIFVTHCVLVRAFCSIVAYFFSFTSFVSVLVLRYRNLRCFTLLVLFAICQELDGDQ